MIELERIFKVDKVDMKSRFGYQLGQRECIKGASCYYLVSLMARKAFAHLGIIIASCALN